jgi:selenocysteine-specific elongation factor
VLSKADLVDAETVDLARLELDEHLTDSPFASGTVVVCDSVSGRGLADVRDALDATLAAAPTPRDDGRPRLWVDRVFAAAGAGTVVTGTLAGGSLGLDEEVEVAPGHRQARIRGIQHAHQRTDRAEPGARIALNLAGIDYRDLRRGDAVVRAGQWAEPTVIDVALRRLGDEAWARRSRVQCYVGSAEHGAWLRVLDAGGRFGRLRLDAPVAIAPGDRLVIRDPGRRTTVGGAEVLDVAPATRARDAPTLLARPLPERLLSAEPWSARDGLQARTGLGARECARLADEVVATGDAVAVGAWLVKSDTLVALQDAAREEVAAFHRDQPLQPGIDVPRLATALGIDAARLRAALAGLNDLVVERGVVRAAGHSTAAAESPEARRLLDALAAAPYSPPDPAELGAGRTLVRALAREGSVVELDDGVVIAAAALDDARAKIQAALAERGALTVAEVRDLLGSSRKYVLPLLARLDAEGVTRRRGDQRIPGPAA